MVKSIKVQTVTRSSSSRAITSASQSQWNSAVDNRKEEFPSRVRETIGIGQFLYRQGLGMRIIHSKFVHFMQ